MKWSIGLIVFSFVSAAFSQSAHIRFARPDYVNFQETMMIMTAYGIPLNPIEEGKKELTVVPAYASADSQLISNPGGGGDGHGSIDTSSTANSIQFEESEASGGGVILNWFHGLGKNWGYSVTASHLRLSGEMAAWNEYDAAGVRSNTIKADEKGHATQIMANFVYDPLYKSKRFNLPIFIGAGFYDSSQEATTTKTVNVTGLSNVPISYSAKVNNLNFGLSLGFAWWIRAGDFSFNIFFMGYFAPDSPTYEVTAVRTDSGASVLNDFVPPNEDESFFPSGGLSISYRPWDVSLSYIPNWFNVVGGDDSGGDSQGGGSYNEETSQSVITISKTFTWK